MAIAFPCRQCHELMRTTAEAGGKNGRCPACGTVQLIPERSQPLTRDRPTENGNVEFACQQCRRDVQVPQTAAGKKGRCPHCQAIVQIPERSQPLTRDRPTENGNVEFACQQCRRDVQVPQTAAGKKGRCPHCQAIVQIPERSQPLTRDRPTENGNVEFACQQCRRDVQVPQTAAGKKGRCPHCQAIVQIPERSQPLTRDRPTENGNVEFACQQCRRDVQVPQTAAGKKGRCPHCQAIVQIPERSQPLTRDRPDGSVTRAAMR